MNGRESGKTHDPFWVLVMEKVSEITVLKLELQGRGKDTRRLKYALAEFLKSKGFAPGHWYANWKELEKNVWLIIGGSERGDPTDLALSVKVSLRDSPPNVGGVTFYAKDVEQFRKFCNEKVKPMVLDLLNESTIPYAIIEGQ